MSEVQRLGDVGKCPACGSEIDPGAYHCPKCRNYFCFRCRARVLEPDPRFHCINQACDYYGKLVCGTCDPEVRKDEPPVVYTEHEGGWWPYLLLGGLVVGVVALFYTTFNLAAVIAAAAAVGVGFLLHRAGVNVLGRAKQIVQPKHSVHHNCIRCQKPVKQLP